MDWVFILDIVHLILIGFVLYICITTAFMIKHHNEQLVALTRYQEQESFKTLAENTQLKIENARLRRLVTGEIDDPDLFPARQHNIVSYKRGNNEDDGGQGVS